MVWGEPLRPDYWAQSPQLEAYGRPSAREGQVPDAEANLGRFIEDVSNTKRLHSSSGYLPLAESEAAHRQRIAAVPLAWSADRGSVYTLPHSTEHEEESKVALAPALSTA